MGLSDRVELSGIDVEDGGLLVTGIEFAGDSEEDALFVDVADEIFRVLVLDCLLECDSKDFDPFTSSSGGSSSVGGKSSPGGTTGSPPTAATAPAAPATAAIAAAPAKSSTRFPPAPVLASAEGVIADAERDMAVWLGKTAETWTEIFAFDPLLVCEGVLMSDRQILTS